MINYDLRVLEKEKKENKTMAGSPVKISPESEIKFELSNAEATPNAVITLKHPGGDAGPVAFKVRMEKDNIYRLIVNLYEEYLQLINSPCEQCSLIGNHFCLSHLLL